MHINDLGMDREVHDRSSVSANTVDKANIKTNSVGSFPSELKSAVKSQSTSSVKDSEESINMKEALERLKNDPEWEDIGTALSALYKNQQQMQIQMSLLSSGYSKSLAGMLPYSSYGYGTAGLTAYNGTANLLANSIFGDMLL